MQLYFILVILPFKDIMLLVSATIRLGVKLNCDPRNEHDFMIPYLVIYEKDIESVIPTLCNVSQSPLLEENNAVIEHRFLPDDSSNSLNNSTLACISNPDSVTENDVMEEVKD